MINFLEDIVNRPQPTSQEKHFKENEIIVSKTDTKGKITYGNEIFIKMSGYAEDELLGKPHNILRHPDMPKAIFKLLWDTIKSKNEINAYVKNLSKDGSYYWVLANITPSYDENEKIIGYFSARRTASQSALEFIKPLYKKLLDIEKSKGMQASIEHINNILQEKGLSYEEFILSI